MIASAAADLLDRRKGGIWPCSISFARVRCAPRCDGSSRREFLLIGTLGMVGLTLADMLRLQSVSAGSTSSKPKSVILERNPSRQGQEPPCGNRDLPGCLLRGRAEQAEPSA